MSHGSSNHEGEHAADGADPAEEQARVGRVVRERDVRAVFQPIVDLSDGTVVAYEALSRVAPSSGFDRVDRLFEAAAAHGRLWELEQVTRAGAITTAGRWSPDLRLFINVSPAVFADGRFAGALVNDLREAPGLSPERMVLEITELAGSIEDEALLQQVEATRELGFQLAVDDAGAGTSGLNRMMVLRPQWIKLDQKIVRAVEDDQLRQNLIRFFVYFARLSGVNVLAEGIETADELAVILNLGVRFGQGYFLGVPEDRATTIDSKSAVRVRERWASVEKRVAEARDDGPLAGLAHPVIVGPAGARLGDAAEKLAGEPRAIGLVTVSGRLPVGWIDRSTLVRAAEVDPQEQLGRLTRPIMCPIPSNATVIEAVHMVCLREDHDLGDPLVVVDGAKIVGALRLRDLLRVLAGQRRS